MFSRRIMGRRRILQGIVVSDKMDKTIIVEVRNLKPHPFYNKVIRRRTKIKANDPENTAREGDIVRVIESRPFSKTKRWAILEVVRRAVGSDEGVQNDIQE
ncbi:30S ribosomal protein S17 [bacterium]|nr:MAG: 30S ribosomal protein S17 [bacterium]